MGVAVEGQRDRRVPGQLLRVFHVHTRTGQRRDELVAEGVKVKIAAVLVGVGDARRVEVGTNQSRGAAVLRPSAAPQA
ncbi:MAG: hypothetical protein AAF532_13855, partial [Planctomycetota bacterium]